MNVVKLNDKWKVHLPDGQVKDIAVPGCVEQVWDNWANEGPYLYETSFKYQGSGQVRMVFEGVSYYCQVYLNGNLLGTHEGIWDSFVLNCTKYIRQGDNLLTVEVTKPGYLDKDAYPLRAVLSGFIPDVLTTFGGIWDEVLLLDAEAFFLYDHHGGGNCSGEGFVTAELDVLIEGNMGFNLRVADPDGKEVYNQEDEIRLKPGPQELKLTFRDSNPKLWSPDNPSLYTYTLGIRLNGQYHEVKGRIGLREITASGKDVLLNGQPFYMRGILHWGYDDERIIPNPPYNDIRHELEVMKIYGFNAIKHCLYIPRKQYFNLMDELGLIAWVELPLWLPEPSPELENRIRREYPRILHQLKGHPSICLLSLGCELDDSVEARLLQEMYNLAKEESGALIRDNSGSGECYGGLAVDFADFYDYHFYAELPHLEELIEHFTPAWREQRPWLFGEFNDSDTMRDLDNIRLGKGKKALHWELTDKQKNPISLLKPDFYLGRHDRMMEENGIRAEMDLIRALSIDHSLTHRKVNLELTRSFPEVCGYNITSIRDVPIATSGMLDDLGQPKFQAEIFRRFNSDATLVQAFNLTRTWVGADRVMPAERYNYSGGTTYSVRILLSNYTGRDLCNSTLHWQLLRGAKIALQGQVPLTKLNHHGSVNEAAYLQIPLPQVDNPETLVLDVELIERNEQVTHNDYPIFVYPHPHALKALSVYDPAGCLDGLLRRNKGYLAIHEDDLTGLNPDILISSVLTDSVRRFVEIGGKLLLLLRGEGSLPVLRAPLWREGMLRPYQHPILKGIEKTTWHDNLRYFSMTTDLAIDTNAMAENGYKDVQPVLRRYDCRAWTATDYICTFRLGLGTCVATTLRFGGGLGKTPPNARSNPYADWLLNSMATWLKTQ